jgi:single-stranded-DNA-specific exonuclease
VPRRDLAAELELAEELTVDPALAQALRARGIRDAGAVARFIFPNLASLTPPADFPDLAEAAVLIVQSCERKGKKIFVAGDYDVDGLTATALLAVVLRRLGADVSYYIPNRLSEGYDLTEETVRRAVEAGAEVLITTDCGSRAHEAVAAARRAGLAVVVTDHHRLEQTLPPANAVVSPQRLPGGHPARDLAGVGVAFKLAHELIRMSGLALEPSSLLPLVALGTVCDVVDLAGENRSLVAGGLAAFPGELSPGLGALMAEAGIEAPVTSWHLAFVLGPRINAAGRLGHAEYALELLLAEDEGRAQAVARKLEDFNRRRRAFEERVAADVMERARALVAAGRRAVVLSGEGWHRGVIGIVASRVVERFYRPTVLVAVEGDVGRGSCRGIPPFDVHEALDALRGYLGRFGGHRLAAGFEIEAEKIPSFAEAFEAFAAERLDDDALRPVFRVDGYLPLAAVSVGLAEDLALLEPVGQGNPAPTFFSGTYVAQEAQRVFKNAHLEVFATAGPTRIRAVGFNLAPGGDKLEPGDYGLVHTPTLDEWRDRKRLELRLGHIKPLAPGGEKRHRAKLIDRRGDAVEEVVRGAGTSGEAVFGLPEQRYLAAGCEFVAYARCWAAGRKWRRLWLAAPPFDAHRLAALCVSAEELVFAFGEREALAAKEFLGRYYPDRTRLTEVYRTMREEGAAAVDGDDEGVRRALAIFEELGLLEEGGRGLAALEAEELRAGDTPRRSLDDSPLFRRCERRRLAAEEFVAALCRWPAAALEGLTAELTASVRYLDTGGGVL